MSSATFTFTRAPVAVFYNRNSIWSVLRVYAPETGKAVADDPYLWFRVSSHVDIGPEADNGPPDIELVDYRLADRTIEGNHLTEHKLERDLDNERLEEQEHEFRCETCGGLIINDQEYYDGDVWLRNYKRRPAVNKVRCVTCHHLDEYQNNCNKPVPCEHCDDTVDLGDRYEDAQGNLKIHGMDGPADNGVRCMKCVVVRSK